MSNVIDALKASKRKATHQRDNWKRMALVYLSALEEIAQGQCCGCCQPDDPQCDVGKAKEAIRTANAAGQGTAKPYPEPAGSQEGCPCR